MLQRCSIYQLVRAVDYHIMCSGPTADVAATNGIKLPLSIIHSFISSVSGMRKMNNYNSQIYIVRHTMCNIIQNNQLIMTARQRMMLLSYNGKLPLGYSHKLAIQATDFFISIIFVNTFFSCVLQCY